MPVPTLRVARPTDDIDRLKVFYINGLGMEALSEFSDHDGYDGLIVGAPDSPYHFEFTQCADHVAGPAPTQENLIVFYLPDKAEWDRAIQSMRDCGFEPVKSFNPYWDLCGRTFEDPDGYRVVLQNTAWE